MTQKEWVSEVGTLLIALIVVGTCCAIVLAEAAHGAAVQALSLPPFMDTALGFVIAFFFNRQATAQVVSLANGKLDSLSNALSNVQAALPVTSPVAGVK